MSARTSPARRLSVLLVFILASGIAVPAFMPGSVEAQVSLYCAPPGSEPEDTDRKYDDYVIEDVDITMLVAGKRVTGERFGKQLVFEDPGKLEVRFTVRNAGTEASTPLDSDPQFDVRVTIDDSGQTMTKKMKQQAAGNYQDFAFIFSDVTPKGAYTARILVNPANADGQRQAQEECRDVRANPDCSDADQQSPCHYKYYFNNHHNASLLIGSFPDLVITDVSVTPPGRASQQATPDTKATVTVSLKNQGDTVAFAHTGTNPGDDDFHLQIDLDKGTCTGAKKPFEVVEVNETITHTYTCEMAGAAGTIDGELTVDVDDVVVEKDETNNGKTFSILVPSPDLRVHLNVLDDRLLDNGTYYVPEGEDLRLELTLQNEGETRAATSTDGSFKVTYKQAGTEFHSSDHTLDPNSGLALPLTRASADLPTDGKTFAITITADDGNKVLESNEDNNVVSASFRVARFEATLAAEETDAAGAMGTWVSVPVTVGNGGTVSDVIDLVVPGSARHVANGTSGSGTHIDVGADTFRYVDADGDRLTQVALQPEEEKDLFAEFFIPKAASVDDTYHVEASAQSRALGAQAGASAAVVNLTFTTTPDDVGPVATLHEPASGLLNTDRIVVRVADNVAVASVATDIAGPGAEFAAIEPDEAGGDLYTLNVSHRQGSFTFKVKAVDVNDNEATTELQLVRDDQKPRILDHDFRAGSALERALPGSQLTLNVRAADDNMDKVTVRITQPAGAGRTHYDENFTLTHASGETYILQWTVPDRPGRYFFDITAHDKAGNTAEARGPTERTFYPGRVVYYVPGLNIGLIDGPRATPSTPDEVGQRVRLTYTLRNTNDVFNTGLFAVRLALDERKFIGQEIIDLQPGETRTIAFDWVVEAGPHIFTLVIDATDSVPEDDEDDNLDIAETATVFQDNRLFQGQSIRNPLFLTFSDRVERYWWLPALLGVNVVLFAVATVLRRQASG